MKLLIVFALIAAACAEQIQVVNLPEAPSPDFAIPSIGQLFIPNAVIEAWKKDFEAIKVALPIMREATVVHDEGLKVNFVDAPLDNAAPVPITLGKPSLPAFETADEFVMIAEPSLVELVPEPVNFVEAPLPNKTPIFVDGPPPLPMEDDVAELSQAELIPEPVKFVEVPLTIEADAPRFVDAPLDIETVVAEPSLVEVVPEPVKFVDSPLEGIVEPIKIATPKLGDYRDKIFNNPMLRSAPTA